MVRPLQENAALLWCWILACEIMETLPKNRGKFVNGWQLVCWMLGIRDLEKFVHWMLQKFWGICWKFMDLFFFVFFLYLSVFFILFCFFFFSLSLSLSLSRSVSLSLSLSLFLFQSPENLGAVSISSVQCRKFRSAPISCPFCVSLGSVRWRPPKWT